MKIKEAELDDRYTVCTKSCGCLIRSTERYGNGDKYILFCREHKAAPEMLAALKMALIWLEIDNPAHYEAKSEPKNCAICKVREAIAKAEGKSHE